MIKIIRPTQETTPACVNAYWAKPLRRRQALRRASSGLPVRLHYKIVNSRSILKNIDLASPFKSLSSKLPKKSF
jgi:hypothetical protein